MLLPNLVYHFVDKAYIIVHLLPLRFQWWFAIRLIEPKRLLVLCWGVCSNEADSCLNISGAIAMVDNLPLITETRIENREGESGIWLVGWSGVKIRVVLGLSRPELILGIRIVRVFHEGSFKGMISGLFWCGGIIGRVRLIVVDKHGLLKRTVVSVGRYRFFR